MGKYADKLLGEDHFLAIGAYPEDLQRGLENQDWCPVILLPGMEEAKEILFCDFAQSTVQYRAFVDGFTHLGGNAWKPNVESFSELEAFPVPFSIEARVNEEVSGDPCKMSTVPGWEASVYPYALLEALEGSPDVIRLAGDKIVELRSIQAREHRADKKQLIKTVRVLLEHDEQPELFKLRDGQEMLRRAINQGYITRKDLEDTLLVPFTNNFVI